jgi:hypothetical protein
VSRADEGSVALVIPLALALGVMFGLRARRRTKSDGHDAWRERWRDLDRGRRRRILRAVRRGEAVSDPRDAALALEFIERQRDIAERMRAGRLSRWFGKLHVALIVVATISVALVARDPVVAGIVCLPLVYIGALRLYGRRLETRIAAARQKNAQLIDRLA